jgi:hypothetical protein
MIVVCAARRCVVVREGMVTWKVPACGEPGRSNTRPTGQLRCPGLCRRRVKDVGAPGEFRRILANLVKVVVMVVKVFLVQLVHAPTRATVEAAMHPLGECRFEGLSYCD